MVTPAMQQQPQVIYGPNGERAEWNGREYVVASPAAPASTGGYQLQPMTTPAEARQREEQAYNRQRDEARDQLTASREERAIEAARRSADTAERAAAKLTEDQGKAGGYAQLMADAERSYQQALREGFNPTGLRAGIANFTDNIPLMGGVGNFIRDDAGDRARQAELQWSDAQLKAMSGAASPEPEVVRNNITFFARPGQNFDYLGERLEDARRVAFESSRRRAGSDLQGLAYPETDPAMGSSPDAPFNFVGASREDTIAAIKRGGWFVNGDGEPYQLPPSDPSFGPQQPGDERVSEGVIVRPQEVRQDASAARTAQGEGIGRKIDAGVRGAADTLTFGLSDEIVAGLNTVLPLDRGSQSLWTEGAGDAYTHNLAMQRGIDQADRRDVPVSRGVGQVAGAFIPGIGVARAATVGTRVARAAQGAGAGAAYGGAYGFGSGEGSAAERLPGAAIGAGIGAFGGAASPFIANAFSRVVAPVVSGVQTLNQTIARPFVNALGDSAPISLREAVQPNALRSGMNRFGDRMGAGRVNALDPRVNSQRDLGMEPALIDVLDDASVGRVRALASRDTSARDSAVKFAEGRRNNLPSRTARIAREEISGDTRPALDIIDAQRTTRRTNADAINTFGSDPVPVSDDLVTALRSDFVRPHLRAAAQRAQGALDPAERESSARLSQIADMALDNPSGINLTVRDAQDISKALNDAAQTAFRNGSPDGPVLRDLATAIRGSAREGSEGYAAWLQRYGEDSDLIEAATTGRNFASVSTDPINARSTEAFVRGAEGASEAGRDIMRASAREAVEVSASNPSGARTTLDKFASDTDQARRAQALGVDAGRLQARSQAEIGAVTAAQRASPRVGSESSTNLQDAGNAAGGIIGAIRRPIDTALGVVVNRVASRGFNDAEAQAIVEAAIDPARTDELIAMLAERMPRHKARNLARAIRFQLTTGPQSGQQR